MEKEERVVEASHVIIGVVQVFVHLAKFLLIVALLQGRRSGIEDVEKKKGERKESEDHGKREDGRKEVGSRLKRYLTSEDTLTKIMLMQAEKPS